MAEPKEKKQEEKVQEAFTATADQIAEWKKKFGGVFAVEVVDDRNDNKKLRCYLKKPDRKILHAAAAFGRQNPMKFNETIFTNCWLAGDEEIKNDDYLRMSAEAQVGDMVQIADATIKEL